MAAAKNTRRVRATKKTTKLVTKQKPVVAVAETTPPKPIPSVWQLSRQTASILWRRRWLFLGVLAWYALLNVVLVRGLSGVVNVTNLRSEFSSIAGGRAGALASGALTYTQLLSSVGSGSTDTAGAYQLVLFLMISLALIWTLRQAQVNKMVRIRDAFYQGMYALVPFALVLGVLALRLIPLIIGAFLYQLAVSNGIAVNGFEQVLWGLLALVMALVSLYFICSAVIALYIVTLPDMTPLKALRAARDLLRHRRWTVLRKMLFLPLLLLLVSALITVPFILLLPAFAPWVFYILSILALAIGHSYLYSLYRGLLHD